MNIEVLMPAVGAGASEGKLIRWLKREGDTVTPGDLLAEIETDKAIVEIEALDGGTLHALLVPEGAEGIAVGSPIALLSDGSAPVSTAAVSSSPAPSLPSPSPAPVHDDTQSRPHFTATGSRHNASPLARRMARQHGLSLDELNGSGPRGRIVKIDVEHVLNQLSAKQKSRPDPVPSTEIVPHTVMRKTIARRLTLSKQQTPHFYLNCDIRMDALLALREQLNTQGKHETPAWRLSINDMLVFAVARTLRRVPEVNASWRDDAVLRHRQADICVAVATDGGLITPILRAADRKSMAEISTEIHALLEKARNGKLAPDDYQGGCFTISNLGMYGIRSFSAIINPPQAAILSVGAVEQRPAIEDGTVIPAQLMSVTLSADHRVIDGAIGARFLATLRRLIEAPLHLLA